MNEYMRSVCVRESGIKMATGPYKLCDAKKFLYPMEETGFSLNNNLKISTFPELLTDILQSLGSVNYKICEFPY